MAKRYQTGQKLWLIPTGNNVKRNATSVYEQAIQVEVEHFGRTKGTFIAPDGLRSEFKVTGDPAYILSGYNGGYYVFESKDRVEAARRRAESNIHLRSKRFNSFEEDEVMDAIADVLVKFGIIKQ